MFDSIFNKGYFICIFIIFIYVVLKEKQEHGCSLSLINKQCNEFQSLYFSELIPGNNDSKDELINKLKNILSIHLKFDIFRKCFIMATLVIVFAKGISPDVKPETLIGLHMMVLSITYFYHNFMNIYIYRLIDIVGTNLINSITMRDKMADNMLKDQLNKSQLCEDKLKKLKVLRNRNKSSNNKTSRDKSSNNKTSRDKLSKDKSKDKKPNKVKRKF